MFQFRFASMPPQTTQLVEKSLGKSGLSGVQKSSAFFNCKVTLSVSCFGSFSPDGILEMIYREKYSYRMILLCNNDWLLLRCIDELVEARLGIFSGHGLHVLFLQISGSGRP